MAELVRVRIKSGNKVRLTNMARSLAEKAGNVGILEGEATHRPDGRPLRQTYESGRQIKPQTTVEEAATAKKATSRSASTDEKKEQDR